MRLMLYLFTLFETNMVMVTYLQLTTKNSTCIHPHGARIEDTENFCQAR